LIKSFIKIIYGMKCIILSLAVLSLFLSACTSTSRVEETTHLGFGFRRVVLAEPSSAKFESIGHFAYLYYRHRRICSLGDCSVSPSGRFVIYLDGPSGRLFLYRRADGRLTELTTRFEALVDTFVWHESAGTVEVRFRSGHGARTFVIP